MAHRRTEVAKVASQNLPDTTPACPRSLVWGNHTLTQSPNRHSDRDKHIRNFGKRSPSLQSIGSC